MRNGVSREGWQRPDDHEGERVEPDVRDRRRHAAELASCQLQAASAMASQRPIVRTHRRPTIRTTKAPISSPAFAPVWII